MLTYVLLTTKQKDVTSGSDARYVFRYTSFSSKDDNPSFLFLIHNAVSNYSSSTV